jgi:transposase InsO family protein
VVSPRENGYVESFNGKLRDELLAREAFDTLLEAKVLIERWRQDYNTIRPRRAGLLGGKNLTSFSCRTWG